MHYLTYLYQVVAVNEEKATKYDTHSSRQMLLRYKLGFALATTSIPDYILENEDFLAYINLLDFKHSVPTRKTTSTDQSDINQIAEDILKEMIGKKHINHLFL